MRTAVAFIGFVGFIAFLSTDDPEGQKQDMDTASHSWPCMRAAMYPVMSRFKPRELGLGLGCLSQAVRM